MKLKNILFDVEIVKSAGVDIQMIYYVFKTKYMKQNI